MAPESPTPQASAETDKSDCPQTEEEFKAIILEHYVPPVGASKERLEVETFACDGEYTAGRFYTGKFKTEELTAPGTHYTYTYRNAGEAWQLISSGEGAESAPCHDENMSAAVKDIAC